VTADATTSDQQSRQLRLLDWLVGLADIVPDLVPLYEPAATLSGLAPYPDCLYTSWAPPPSGWSCRPPTLQRTSAGPGRLTECGSSRWTTGTD